MDDCDGHFFVAVKALVKFMRPTMPAVQAAFLRYALRFILLVSLLSWRKKSPYINITGGWRLRGA